MLASYYDDFFREYFAAKQRGKELGVQVGSIAIETMSILRERTCDGKIALTPEGTISTCARVSSPREALYDQYIYGVINGDGVTFDEEKFRRITAENNIHTQNICADCFARWNCGGGCRLFHQSFGPEFLKPKCDFTRRGLRQELFNTLNDKFHTARQVSLEEYIGEKITRGEI